MPRIIPIRDLKDTTEISRLCHASNEPVFVTKNGYGDMVIMSMEAYEAQMFLQDAVKKIAAAEDEIEHGAVKDAHATLAALKEKYAL